MKTSRRKLIRNALGMTAGAAAITPVAADDRIQRFILKKKGGVRKGRINQSVVSWCFAEYWSTDKMCRVAKDLGCKSIELISPDEFPTLKKHGTHLCYHSYRHGRTSFRTGLEQPKIPR